MQKYSFEAIGTWWQIEAETDKDLLPQIKARINAYDKVFSRFRQDSLVTQISKEIGSFTFPNEAEALFGLYKKLYDLTDGTFTPLIGGTLSQAGYDADYSLETKNVTSPPKWESVMSYKHPVLTTTAPVLLDVGAAGKGQLIDIVGDLIGVEKYTVDAGGDILVKGELQIGLEHPNDTSKAIGIAHIKNKSICGSSGNRRKWGEFHHIIDPHKLKSPKEILAVWVVADTTMLADALSTALFFVEPQTLEEFSFDYVVLYADYSVSYSKSFPGEIFS